MYKNLHMVILVQQRKPLHSFYSMVSTELMRREVFTVQGHFESA